MPEQIQIVDEKDNPIGGKDREDLLSTDIYRVASLWPRNSHNQVLLLQRAFTKFHQPGCWHPMSGTVRFGESYEENVYREAQEELGIRGVEFTAGPKLYIEQPGRRLFVQEFWYDIDWPESFFTIDPKDNEAIKWWPLHEMKITLQNQPDLFVPNLSILFNKLFPDV